MMTQFDFDTKFLKQRISVIQFILYFIQDTMEDVDVDQATGGADGSKMSPPPYDSAPTSPTSPNTSEKPVHEKGPYYVNKAGGPHGSAALFGPSLTTKNLFCWAFQVARGMEFLAARKVSESSSLSDFLMLLLQTVEI